MKKLVLGTLILTAVLLSTVDASAHSALIRAEPPPNSVVATAPAAVTLWFDEALDTQFSSVSVLNTSRASVDIKKVQFSPDRQQMTVAFAANVPPGAYTVVWRALSAADGHITSSSYSIFVGAASVGHSPPGSLAGLEAAALPLPLDVIVRWVNLLAALALSGAMTLTILLGDSHATFAAVRMAVARRLSIWVVANLVVLFGGAIVSQMLEAAAASGQGVSEVFAQGIWLSMLTSTHFGQAALARILLVDASVVLYLSSLRTIDRWRIKPLWSSRAVDLIYFLLSALILLTFSLASHAASTNDPLGLTLLVDWLHLLAIGAWTGGLFALTIVLRPALQALPEGTRLDLSRLILRRFSGLTVASVILFALTGLYAMWRQVAYPTALVSTAYGQTLIIKNIMVVPLLLIGAINTLLLRPNLLARIGDWSLEVRGRRWRSPQAVVTKLQSLAASVQLPNVILRLVRIEAVLGALVVLAAATLTALPPARTAAPPPLPPPFQATSQADDVTVSLKVEPYIVGNDTFEINVTDSHGNPLPNVTRVNLLLTFLEADLGMANVEAVPAGNGLYKIEGGYLSVIGPWQAEAVVRRKDIVDDLRVSYGLNVSDPANNRTDELPTFSPGVAVAILDLLGGTLLLIYARRKRLVATRSMGISALMLGVALIAFSIWSTALPTPDLPANPQVVNFPTAALPIPTVALTPAPPGLDAQALLVKADSAMNQLSSLTELQRFTNDAGMVVVSATYQYRGPDKLRFSVSNGNESIAIGDAQYYHEPGSAWEKQDRASTVRWPNYNYAETASQAKVDGQDVVDGEPSVVVSFKAPGVDLYRAWIGMNTGRLRRLQMVAPGHNMLSTYSQFNAPLDIAAPPDGTGSALSSQSLPDPLALLAKSDAAMNQLSALRKVQRINDDAGDTITTTYDYVAPDRLHFASTTGTEIVVIHDMEYDLNPGASWAEVPRTTPWHWPDFNNARSASQVKLEGEEVIDGELCDVITFKIIDEVTYRVWIGQRSGWLRRQLMDAPDHHMVITFAQFNTPAVIAAPIGAAIPLAVPEPTPTTVPTPVSALGLLARSDAAMNRLASVTEIEVLGSDPDTALTTTTEYLAPDRFHFALSTGQQSVAITDNQYYLEPGQQWQKTQRAAPVQWPDFNYAGYVLYLGFDGEQVVAGELCDVLMVKSSTLTYRFWVGKDTLWLRQWQMEGPGHHMLTTYRNFNAPLTISAPQ